MISMRRWAPLAGAMSLVCAISVAGTNSWTQNGPEGGSTRSVAVSPTQPERLVASTDGGIYYSTDAGASWTHSNAPNVSWFHVEFAPNNANRVVTNNAGLVVSDDGGVNFTALPSAQQPPVAGIYEARYSSDGGLLYASVRTGRLFRTANMGANWTEITGPWPLNSNNDLAVATDPNSPNTVYAAMPKNGTTPGGLYKSTDAGEHWSTPATGPASDIYLVHEIAVKPGDSNRIIVAANDGFWTSSNGAASWTNVRPGASHTAAFDPANPQNVVTEVWGEVFRSSNSGDTLVDVGSALLNYQSVSGLKYAGNKLYVASGDGPLVSTDNGTTFVPKVSGIVASTLQAVSGSNDGAAYAVFAFGPFGIFKRLNGNWQKVNDASLLGPLLNDVATAPQNGKLVYALSQFRYVSKSVDGGATWAYVGNPLFSNSRVLKNVIIDPNNEEIVYVVASDGLWQSTNGSVSWTHLTSGLPPTVNGVGVLPGNSQIVFAATESAAGTSVYKSINGGASFAPTAALPVDMAYSLNVSPFGSVFVPLAGVLHRSDDQGLSWHPVAGATGGNVLFDPQRSKTFALVQSGNSSAFVRTVDGGLTWEEQSTPQPFTYRTFLDPARPGLFYAGTTGGGLNEFQVATAMAVTLNAPLAPAVGSNFNATVSIRNDGRFGASQFSLQVNVPAFLTPTAPAGCTFSAPVLTCQVAYLSGNAATGFDIPMVANAAGQAALTAQIATHEPDTDAADNVSSLTIHSGAKSDMAVTIANGTRTVEVNGTLNMSLTATNLGPDAANNARVTIAVPAAYSFATATSTVGTCTGTATALVTCSFGTLAKDASATVTLSGTALTPTTGATASVEARSDVADDVGANNTATATFVINAAPTPPPPSGGGGGGGGGSSGGGGGGGGGGSYDALALLLLGGLLVRKLPTRAAR